MKRLTYVVLFLTVSILQACKYDNYNPPQIDFTGRLLYNGNSLLFDGWSESGGLSKIIELHQSGFGKSGVPITASVASDGTFRQKVFAGDYQITLKNTSYPFTFDNWSSRPSGGYDSLSVKIDGNYNLDIPVIPYFEIENVSWEVVGTNLNVTFNIKRVQEGANVTKARVYVNTTSIVNSGTRASAEVNVTDISNPITIQYGLPDYRVKFPNNFKDFAFIRVALETNKSTSYFLWSDTYKAENLPVEFLDVSEDYLKNYKQPFTIETWFNDRRGKVKDWMVDPGVEPSMFDGWNDRRFMGAENWGGGTPVVGSVWQTATLPAGKYTFLARRGWNNGDLNGGLNRAWVVVSKGDRLDVDGPNLLAKQDCAQPANRQAITIDFSLAEPTKLNFGYSVDFKAGELNAVSFVGFSFLKVD